MIILVKQKDLDDYIAEQERIHGENFDRDKTIADFIAEHGITVPDDDERLQKLNKPPLAE